MKDVDKARFLDAPISQAGLFGDTVEGFAQQFSAVQQQTEAIQHILTRRDAPSTAAPGARPQSARRRGRPPASCRRRPNRHLGWRVGPLTGERRPPHPSQAPSHPGSWWSGPDAGDPEMLEFALSQETARTALLLPPVEGQEENLPFHFVSVPVPLFLGTETTRSVASSHALAHGASLTNVCRAAGWATPNTFAGFYNLRVEPVSSRVLGK